MPLRTCLLALLMAPLWAADDAFLLLDGQTGARRGENAAARFPACSAAQIPLALALLDSGVAPPVPYDARRDGPQNGAAALDQDLRSALRFGVDWYFREVARLLRPERMARYRTRFRFEERISANEPVEFLRRLRENRLEVTASAAEDLREMLLFETTPEYRWYARESACGTGEGAWNVGFVEREDGTFYYALHSGGGVASARERLSRAGLVEPRAPDARRQMEARVSATVGIFPGTVSLFAKNLDTGESFGLRADERVRTASTIKLPIMAATFAAVAQSKVKWVGNSTLRERDKVSGSGVLHEFSPGAALPLRDLVHLMIVVSDNTATNLVLDRVPADFVNAEMARLGLKDTRSLRKVLGDGEPTGFSREGLLPEFKRFGLGVSTPREMALLLEKIDRGEVVSPEACREMLAILGRQQYKDGIGRRLPDWQVESKSGSLDRLRSDVGLVRWQGGRAALALTVDDMPRTDYSPENAGQVLISRLTGMLLEGLSAPVKYLSAPERVVELQAAMAHVQGIEVEGNRLWVTWVDRGARAGYLGEFDLTTGKLVRSTPVQKGERYHPGGLAADGDSLWVPVAEYKAAGSSVIQKRAKRNLELEAEFEVQDHIGCMAAAEGKLYGGNWDAKQIYTWDHSGRQLAKTDNRTGTRFQDMKAAGGRLVGGGIRAGAGSIDWFDPREMRLSERILAGKTDRGTWLTREGMAISGERLYLLPEDAPSRVFIFRLPR